MPMDLQDGVFTLNTISSRLAVFLNSEDCDKQTDWHTTQWDHRSQ